VAEPCDYVYELSAPKIKAEYSPKRQLTHVTAWRYIPVAFKGFFSRTASYFQLRTSKLFVYNSRYTQSIIYIENKTKQQTNCVAFSPQANYIDCAIAAGQRISVPTFADRGSWRGQRELSQRP
jgi:hypothetical protein